MALDRPRSAKKTLSPKASADKTQATVPEASVSSRKTLLPKHKVWIVVALAAVVVIAIGVGDQRGLGAQLFNRWFNLGAAPSAATFVGSQNCAGCHKAEA